MEKKSNFWFGFAMLLLGTIIGFFIAPMKKGVKVKNICGNQLMPEDLLALDDDEDFELDDDDSCECDCCK